MADFLPIRDGAFGVWAANFADYAAAHAAALGLAPGDVAPLAATVAAWDGAYHSCLDAQRDALVATRAKKDARAAAQRTIRALAHRLQASAAVSDADRRALGLTVRDPKPTRVTAAHLLPLVPIGLVDASQRFRHRIRFRDAATPTRRAKPAGVLGCEIWSKIGGAPPAGPSECRFLALVTGRFYDVTYPGEHAGQMAHYLLRWSARGPLPGPWSETVSATIAG